MPSTLEMFVENRRASLRTSTLPKLAEFDTRVRDLRRTVESHEQSTRTQVRLPVELQEEIMEIVLAAYEFGGTDGALPGY